MTSTPSPRSELTAEVATQWMADYFDAWKAHDDDAVAALFTDDAIYQSVPGVESETFIGPDAIKKYWTAITADQYDMVAIQGTPIIQGNQALIEIWVNLKSPSWNPDGDHSVTLIEANVLTFENGLVSRNAEYWNAQMTELAPPAGWGVAN